ncbi:hypothetical protein GLYMA_04G094166v4 [Glycine max]|nr:hypothetical protein GLYMA_04G094166v4 [Glycine max]KAG4392216.1 hypothetical protein GLYMA_04G094166v4 [Glycine max]KAH1110607.1 hypothetical protein GYH30_009438 [Glycine max]KAH1110608.1 hypothetical protein GYH30_009438 [Glycine max]
MFIALWCTLCTIVVPISFSRQLSSATIVHLCRKQFPARHFIFFNLFHSSKNQNTLTNMLFYPFSSSPPLTAMVSRPPPPSLVTSFTARTFYIIDFLVENETFGETER